MFGNNPIRPPVKSDGNSLLVKSIFLTLQGEGPFAGRPSVFVRLGGCNLQCSFCDTEFEEFEEISIATILAEIDALRGNIPGRMLVVITGGEPLRQEIRPFCEHLLAKGYDVQLETNGTLYRPLPREVSVVCSPKPGKNGYAMLREDLAGHIIAVKFLVSTHLSGYQDIAEIGQTRWHLPVYIQPIDEQDLTQNKLNIELAMNLAYKYNSRMSLQLHKLLGIE